MDVIGNAMMLSIDGRGRVKMYIIMYLLHLLEYVLYVKCISIPPVSVKQIDRLLAALEPTNIDLEQIKRARRVPR